MTRERLLLLAVLALLGTIASPAGAQRSGLVGEEGARPDALIQRPAIDSPPEGAAQAHESARTAQHLSRAQAAAQARELHGGRVLSVRWTGHDYRVKLLRQGEVRIVRIADAPPE